MTRRLGLLLGTIGTIAALTVLAVAAAPRAHQWWKLNHTVAPNSGLSEQCDDVPATARRLVLIADDGVRLGAAEIGDADAPTAVLLRYGASQTLCDWLPWAAALAEDTDTRVLVFDRRGRGSSPGTEDIASEPADVASAAAQLRITGAEHLVLVGSSMGNSVTLASLPLLEHPPCALVSISPVVTAVDAQGSLDGSAADPLPAQTWITYESQNPAIASTAKLLAMRAGEQDSEPHLLPVDTTDHSRQLVANHREAAAFVTDAVTGCVLP